MEALPPVFKDLGSESVVIVRNEGTDDEERVQVEAHIQPKQGFFPIDAPVYEGDLVEYADPRGGTASKTVDQVSVHSSVPAGMRHIEVTWAVNVPRSPSPKTMKSVAVSDLHPEVANAAGQMYADGHFSQAVFEACKALEARVRQQSGVDSSGRDLMAKAFGGNPPRIDLSMEPGRSGQDEQEGVRLIFMGLMQGIRNPKGHALVAQISPQRAFEYLAMVSVLFRRLDDAVDEDGNGP